LVERPIGDGERRHLTVMFCDLVGSTELSGELDPEELQAIVLAYQQLAAEAIERHGGYIAHYMGDGVLAYFGFPIADERAGSHAVRAGLDLIELVEQRRAQIPGLSVRVGVHAGITVVADMGAGATRQIRDIVGETPNIAARIQSLAQPDQVVVSADVAATCRGVVEFETLGAHELKGVRRPLELLRAVSVSGTDDRLDRAEAQHGLTPLVGRDEELAHLVEAWHRTLAGEPQVVWVIGEPGLGKSRLVRELLREVHLDGGIEIEFRCSALHQSSILHSSAEQFRRYFWATLGVVGFGAAPRLADENGTPRGLAVPVIADLLGIPLVEPYQAVRGSADHVRHHTLEVVSRLVEDRARRQPVLVVFDDLQWMDGTSLEMATRFLGAQRSDRVMTVVTHRSDPAPSVPALAHHHVLDLERLGEDDVRTIVAHVARGVDVSGDLLEVVARRTEGVPLFAEELAHLIGQPGGDDAPAIPATLRDSLMARVDRLGVEVGIVRTLAVLGREATENLLWEVSAMDRQGFDTGVDRLIERGMLIRRGSGAQAVYSFRHGLLEEVVYDSMLKSTRRAIHERSAAVIESRFADRSAIQPEVSARHLELSGQIDRAVPYLLRAGDRAIAISAHDEALTHLHHALELIDQLPDGPERDLLEIDAQVKLGVPLTARFGYAAPEAERAYARARELSNRTGDAAPAYPPIYGLFRTRLLAGDYDDAERIAAQLTDISAAQPDRTAWMVGAARASGSVAFYRGADHRRTLELLGTVLDAPDADRAGAFLGDLNDVVDPVITCRSYAAWTQWLLGEAKHARESSDRALLDARRLGHPFSLGLALSFDSWLTQFEGDVDATIDRAAEALDHARAHDFPFWVGWAEVLLAWGAGRRGDIEAPADMRAGIERWQQQGSRLGISYFHALVADTETHLGELGAARATLDRAVTLAEEMGEYFWMPEMLRLCALIERRSQHAGASNLLDRATELAASQHAVALLERIRLTRDHE
jgi:class 3 adenylate cyclase/tetratricopeptide (TPR) repeat protein